MTRPDYKKITQVLNYIAGKEGGKINYMKALKLAYLADRLHLRKYGRLITEDKMVAMQKGTLGSQALDIIGKNVSLPHNVYQYVENRLKRDLDRFTIEARDRDRTSLSETDIECLDKVYYLLGDKGEFDLAELTHKLPEWKRYEYIIEKKEKSVVAMQMFDLFEPTENPELNQLYSQPDEELYLSRNLFRESLEQEKYLS